MSIEQLGGANSAPLGPRGGDHGSIPARPAPSPLQSKIASVGDHCLQTMKLLESHEKRILMSGKSDINKLAPVAEEIQVLREVLSEHRSEAGDDTALSPLIKQVEVKLHALEFKLSALQNYGTKTKMPTMLFQAAVEKNTPASSVKRTIKATSKPKSGTVSHQLFWHTLQLSGKESAAFQSLSPGSSSRYPGADKLGREISDTATHVLKVQKYLEDVDPGEALKVGVIDQHTIDHLHSRIEALESALAKTTARWPDSRLSKQLEAQISLLRAKVHTVEAYRQALQQQ